MRSPENVMGGEEWARGIDIADVPKSKTRTYHDPIDAVDHDLSLGLELIDSQSGSIRDRLSR